MDPAEKRRRCRAYALGFIDIQRGEFRRLGIFGDWAQPYLTLAPAYQATIVRELGRSSAGARLQGAQARLLVHALQDGAGPGGGRVRGAGDPVGLREIPPRGPPAGLAGAPRPSVVIWTTTPWTLPANLAIAVNPSEKYVALDTGDETLIVAAGLADQVVRVARLKSARRLRTFEGTELAGLEYRHPWIERTGRIAAASFVAMDAGSGLVHIAPGHGEEDYELGRALGLPIYNPVDDDGRFIPEVAHFAGLTVLDANPRIIALLKERNALLAEVPLTHTYPHCWRCKNPTLFRATEQWFITLDQAPRGGGAGTLREQALAALPTVQWIPPWGEERITNMIEHRPDWCISRQRVWGVPIVAFYCETCSTILLEEPVVEHVAARMEAGEGADVWYLRSAAELLPARTRAAKCGGRGFRKETDILDVWFESGCSHAAVLEKRPQLSWPADLYLEGADQHRGWFHSSLLAAVGTRGRPPYRAVLTHGFVVDGAGRKMSKSTGTPWPRTTSSRSTARRSCGSGRPAGLHSGHPALRRDPRPAGGGIPAGPQHLPVLLGNLDDFDPARTRSRTPSSLPWTPGRAAAPPDDRAGAEGVRDLRVPPRVPEPPRLLRRGPLGAVSRHPEGPALHLGGERAGAPRGPDDLYRPGALVRLMAPMMSSPPRTSGTISGRPTRRGVCTSPTFPSSTGRGSTRAPSRGGRSCSESGVRRRRPSSSRAPRSSSAPRSTPA